jgi:sortase (surface protein transpeptidase)
MYLKKNAKYIMRRLPWVLAALAALVLLVGIVAAVYDWHTNTIARKHATVAIAQANKGVSNGTPSTTPISASTFANYHVAPNLPRYIFIPKLNVKAIVLSLGTTAANQLQSPPNIYETGWYKNSNLPGQAGAMLIDGHVSSWTYHGVFYGIKTLAPGDTIQIERGDGTMLTFVVITSKTYSSNNVNMTAALSPINPHKPGLNLITCTGQVVSGTNEFNQRVVVFAEQV